MTEARVIYGPQTFEVVGEGAYVRCAVTGRPIPLAQLNYWSVELQEAYVDAAVASARYEVWRKAGFKV